MTPTISINDTSFAQICGQVVGIHGVEVEDSQHAGTKFVLMSVEGYEQLRQLAYDDSEWTEQELTAAAEYVANGALTEDIDSEGMSEYDNVDQSAQEQ
jgi:hypothetical protein